MKGLLRSPWLLAINELLLKDLFFSLFLKSNLAKVALQKFGVTLIYQELLV